MNSFGQRWAYVFRYLCATGLLVLTGCHQLTTDLETESDARAKALKSELVRPIQALYLTDYSAPWHNYQEQQKKLLPGVSSRLNIEFHMVGKGVNDTLDLLSVRNFAEDYDVVIYNFCLPDVMDLEKIHNAMAQTRDYGTAAVHIHCAAHSFWGTSPSMPENALQLAAAKAEWSDRYGDMPFPEWWKFVGIDSVNRLRAQSLTASQSGAEHPVLVSLPETLRLEKDELFLVNQEVPGLTPLYTVQDRRGEEHPVAWHHTVGRGKVFGTSLGHSIKSIETDEFQQLLANGIAYVTGRLSEDGSLEPGFEGTIPVNNYQSTVTCQVGTLIEARTIDDVQSAVRRANQLNQPLKVISVQRSNSNNGFVCPTQNGVLLNLWQMNRVLSIDTANNTVTVQPGVRAFELSSYLHEYGYAITTMPDYTGVSIAGGIATGAHHSSLKIASSMADLVREIVIIDGLGQRRIFSGDDAAKAAVHIGMLGVVVEITLAIEPQYKLRYGHESGADTFLEYEIEDKVRQHDYARVMWFAGNNRYVLDHYDRVDSKESGQSRHNLWTSSGNIFRIVGDVPYRILNQAPLRAQCDSALLRSRLWSPPFERIQSERGAITGWSHEMLGSTCEPGRCPWDTESVKSRTMEAAFPLRKLSEWMTDVRGIIRSNRACFPVLGIYLRFSKASDRWMGFNYGEDMVAFEIHVPKVSDETYPEKSANVYDEILQLTLRKYNGRPHWGKNEAPAFVGVSGQQYDRWSDFVALKRRLDPRGLFENRIWRTMIQEEEIKNFPACSLSRDCECRQDSDCGSSWTCNPGAFFQDARVCQ